MQVIGEENPERDFMNIKKSIYTFFLIVAFASCNNDGDDSQNLIDNLGVVDLTIDLSDPDNQVLMRNKGFKYFDGGRRGILVINRNFNEYVAFERNCTFQPNNECASVSMHPSLEFLLDSCCSSRFNLNGQAIEPPATDPLIQYSTFQVGNELRIQFP